MPSKLNIAIASVIGIDIGKNSFHVVGQDQRGTIVLRQKWSRGQVEARLANLPPCLIGMEACVRTGSILGRVRWRSSTNIRGPSLSPWLSMLSFGSRSGVLCKRGSSPPPQKRCSARPRTGNSSAGVNVADAILTMRKFPIRPRAGELRSTCEHVAAASGV